MKPNNGEEIYYRRFGPFEIGLHVSVVISFLGLALTGLILKYAETSWAKVLAAFLGGVPAAGGLHRFFALVTFGYFFVHLMSLWGRYREKRLQGRWLLRRERILGPNSLIPRGLDFKHFFQQFGWYVGLRPTPPTFDRWSYFEKFDYWAVFWGVAVIGSSGLLLWFKDYATLLLPGWLLNAAFIVHSEEALLAVGFIFAIHFFNTHLRPESFPIDLVIFTGVLPEREFRLKHPAEFERLQREGRLEERRAAPPPGWAIQLARTFGFTALGTGIALLVLIFLTALGVDPFVTTWLSK